MADPKVTFLLVVVLWRVFGYGDAGTCEGSKAAYASSGFPVTDVPDSPISGKMRLARGGGEEVRAVLYVQQVTVHDTQVDCEDSV